MRESKRVRSRGCLRGLKPRPDMDSSVAAWWEKPEAACGLDETPGFFTVARLRMTLLCAGAGDESEFPQGLKPGVFLWLRAIDDTNKHDR